MKLKVKSRYSKLGNLWINPGEITLILFPNKSKRRSLDIGGRKSMFSIPMLTINKTSKFCVLSKTAAGRAVKGLLEMSRFVSSGVGWKMFTGRLGNKFPNISRIRKLGTFSNAFAGSSVSWLMKMNSAVNSGQLLIQAELNVPSKFEPMYNSLRSTRESKASAAMVAILFESMSNRCRCVNPAKSEEDTDTSRFQANSKVIRDGVALKKSSGKAAMVFPDKSIPRKIGNGGKGLSVVMKLKRSCSKTNLSWFSNHAELSSVSILRLQKKSSRSGAPTKKSASIVWR